MNTRRELLKYFGIGTVIVPLVSGAPDVRTPAKLISEPDIKPVILSEVKPLDLRVIKSLTLTIECLDGSRHSIQSEYVFGRGLIRPEDRCAIRAEIFNDHSSPRNQIGLIESSGWLA